MADLIKDAFQSMDLSTEKLTEVLNVAKQSDAKKLNDRELQQIEEMLRKLSASFDLFSAQDIMQTKVAEGEFAGQKDKLEQIAQQYQQMEALIANMTQTLMGLESVRNRFSQLHGSYSTLLSSLEKSQRTSAASRLKLTQFSLNQTKDTIEKATEHFKRQLLDLITLYEVLGAQYFQLAAVAQVDEYSDEQPEPPTENSDSNDGEAQETSNTEQTDTEQADAEQADAEQTEQLAQEQAEAELLAQEQADAEQAELLAQEQADAELLAQEQADAELLAQEQADAELLAQEQAEAELLAQEQAEAELLAQEQADAEQAELLAQEQADAELLAQEQAEAEQAELLAQEQAEAELLAQEQAEAELLA